MREELESSVILIFSSKRDSGASLYTRGVLAAKVGLTEIFQLLGILLLMFIGIYLCSKTIYLLLTRRVSSYGGGPSTHTEMWQRIGMCFLAATILLATIVSAMSFAITNLAGTTLLATLISALGLSLVRRRRFA